MAKLKAIQSLWITTAANVAITPYHRYTFTLVNYTLNLAIDNEEATAAIAAGSKWVITFVIGQTTAGD